MRAALALAASLLACAACAPTALAPSIIRVEPVDPKKWTEALSVRSGPRPSAVALGYDRGTFNGDPDSFNIPEWSMAWDARFTKPVGKSLALHLAVQAEFLYPVPVPAVGLSPGISYLVQTGKFSAAPAIALRGSTDFGINSVGGPASLLGGDLSITLSFRPEDQIWVGTVPFISYSRLFTSPDRGSVIFTGGWLFGRYKRVQLMAGMGRVFMSGGKSWNVPLLGIGLEGN